MTSENRIDTDFEKVFKIVDMYKGKNLIIFFLSFQTKMNGMQPKVPVYDIPKVSHEGKVSLHGVKSLHGFSHRPGVHSIQICDRHLYFNSYKSDQKCLFLVQINIDFYILLYRFMRFTTCDSYLNFTIELFIHTA